MGRCPGESLYGKSRPRKIIAGINKSVSIDIASIYIEGECRIFIDRLITDGVEFWNVIIWVCHRVFVAAGAVMSCISCWSIITDKTIWTN
jgi:hypothetical protein